MFHTPGFFRALQNDYRIKGEPRRRAVKILSDGYGMPREEAKGLLSGPSRSRSTRPPAPSPIGEDPPGLKQAPCQRRPL